MTEISLQVPCIFTNQAKLSVLRIHFFYQGFLSRTLTIHRTAEEGTDSYSCLPLPSTDEHLNIYLQLCM